MNVRSPGLCHRHAVGGDPYAAWPGYRDLRAAHVSWTGLDHLARIVGVLYAHGADPRDVDPRLGRALEEFYAAEPVGAFLRRPEADPGA